LKRIFETSIKLLAMGVRRGLGRWSVYGAIAPAISPGRGAVFASSSLAWIEAAGTIRRVLYDRELERSRICELLDGARESRSGVLVIRGEAGVGISALLEEARERGSDLQVLRGSGIESEAELPFAALHQIVRPVLGYVESLPEPQARSIRAALGLELGEGADRFLISLAVLSLLAEAAEQQPLLCLIEDAHWLDDASADALVFVARRLEAEAIVMLFTARERDVRRFDASGLPELQLGALDPEAAGELPWVSRRL
jgi:predicted ATPase